MDYIVKPFSSEEVMARVYVHFKMPVRDTPVAIHNVNAPLAITAPGHHPDGRDGRIMAAALGLLHDTSYAWQGVEALASKVGVIEKRLTDLFRKQFGMTVSEYQINQRTRKRPIKTQPREHANSTNC